MTIRTSFILHNDSLLIFDELTDEQAGKLFKAIKKYNQTGEIVELDFALKLALVPFLNQFKRDQEKWIEECKRSSDKGKLGNLKRWHPDLCLQVEREELTLDEAIYIAKHRPPIPPDPQGSPPIPKSLDSVNDSVNDKEEIIDNTQNEFEEFWNLYDYKKSKPKALIAFKASLKKDHYQTIIAGVNAYIQSRGSDKQYWKHPTTWLNAEAWKDEYTKSNPESSKFSSYSHLK